MPASGGRSFRKLATHQVYGNGSNPSMQLLVAPVCTEAARRSGRVQGAVHASLKRIRNPAAHTQARSRAHTREAASCSGGCVHTSHACIHSRGCCRPLTCRVRSAKRCSSPHSCWWWSLSSTAVKTLMTQLRLQYASVYTTMPCRRCTCTARRGARAAAHKHTGATPGFAVPGIARPSAPTHHTHTHTHTHMCALRKPALPSHSAHGCRWSPPGRRTCPAGRHPPPAAGPHTRRPAACTPWRPAGCCGTLPARPCTPRPAGAAPTRWRGWPGCGRPVPRRRSAARRPVCLRVTGRGVARRKRARGARTLVAGFRGNMPGKGAKSWSYLRALDPYPCRGAAWAGPSPLASMGCITARRALRTARRSATQAWTSVGHVEVRWAASPGKGRAVPTSSRAAAANCTPSPSSSCSNRGRRATGRAGRSLVSSPCAGWTCG